jgi:hypothetical protein
MKYHLLYKTTNLLNGHYYIGVHCQDALEFDGYFGSGQALTAALRKYGRENFVREILEVFTDAESAFNREVEIVQPIYLLRECYNMNKGGRGARCGFSRGRNIPEHERKATSQRQLGERNCSKKPGVGDKISAAKKGVPNYKNRGKTALHLRGTKWWNNGEEQLRSIECPGEDWQKGMLPLAVTKSQKNGKTEG